MLYWHLPHHFVASTSIAGVDISLDSRIINASLEKCVGFHGLLIDPKIYEQLTPLKQQTKLTHASTLYKYQFLEGTTERKSQV